MWNAPALGRLRFLVLPSDIRRFPFQVVRVVMAERVTHHARWKRPAMAIGKYLTLSPLLIGWVIYKFTQPVRQNVQGRAEPSPQIV